MALMSRPLLLLSRSELVKNLVSTMPVSAGIVRSYVPGETTDAVVDATAREVDEGIRVTLDFLGEDTLDADQAEATVAAYLEVLEAALRPRPDPDGRGLGEAVRDRPGAAGPGGGTRSRSRTPAPSAGPHATPAPR